MSEAVSSKPPTVYSVKTSSAKMSDKAESVIAETTDNMITSMSSRVQAGGSSYSSARDDLKRAKKDGTEKQYTMKGEHLQVGEHENHVRYVPGELKQVGNSAGTKLVPKNPDQLARPQTATERSLIWTGAAGKASDGTEVVGTGFMPLGIGSDRLDWRGAEF